MFKFYVNFFKKKNLKKIKFFKSIKMFKKCLKIEFLKKND
jgi:hypothetical protein